MKKTLYVLSIGIINIPTGKTMHDWSIYEWAENFPQYPVYVSLTRGGSLLYGASALENGTELELRGNDSQRLLGKDIVVDSSICKKDDVLTMLKRNGYDYYPIRPFAKRPANNNKLKTSYSIK